MRVLFVLACVCNLLLVAAASISYAQSRKEVIELRSELWYLRKMSQPITEFLVTRHSAYMDRLTDHWSVARALAVASALASISGLVFSMKKRGKDVC